ncbi:MAG: S-adenosylmethionine synthetase N-terminal domain-containing protein, partial [Candidatus Poseidoniaceae archaeon]
MTVELFTSESVTSGHPDKLCDAISDTIVDACLAVDKSVIVLAGEVSLDGKAPDYEALACSAANGIGYTDHAIGMDATDPDFTDVHVHITTQAANIAQGVNDLGAN